METLLLIRLRTNASVCIQNAFRTYLRRKNFEKERKENAARRSSKRTSNDYPREYTISGEKLVWYKHALGDGYANVSEQLNSFKKFSARTPRENGLENTDSYSSCVPRLSRRSTAAILDSNGTETHEDLLPTLSDDSFDDFDVIVHGRSSLSPRRRLLLCSPLSSSSARRRGRQRYAVDAFDEDLHADLLAMRAKKSADERKRRERVDSNLRVLYGPGSNRSARCRPDHDEALRAS